MRKRLLRKRIRIRFVWPIAAVLVAVLMYGGIKLSLLNIAIDGDENYPYLIESSVPTFGTVVDENGVREVTLAPASQNGYSVFEGVFVRNSTKHAFDIKALMTAPLPFDFKDKKGTILIVHSHGSESYAVGAGYYYTLEENDRTNDTDYNMIRVGDELENLLKDAGYAVVHDRTINDQPDYNGSYDRMMGKIKEYQEKHPDIKIVLDLHRDYLVAADGSKYKPTALVEGEKFAQMMLLMGSDQTAFPYKKWQENLSFALKLQKKINEEYPTLMRPIEVKESRYNQHLTTGSLLVEVGSSSNTLEEALRSVRVLGEQLVKLLEG